LKDINPLALKPIVLNPRNSNLPASLKRAIRYALTVLQREYERYNSIKVAQGSKEQPLRRPSWMLKMSQGAAFDAVRDQVVKFCKKQWPFERDLEQGESSLTYWTRLEGQDQAQPLVVMFLSLFEVLPELIPFSPQHISVAIFSVHATSINNERTQSTVKWMSPALRRRQYVATVGRLILVRKDTMRKACDLSQAQCPFLTNHSHRTERSKKRAPGDS
jgi:hypothetical protein